MEQQIFLIAAWILVFYIGISIVIGLGPKIFQYYYKPKSYHLVIITLNSQQRIEWMIWSYQFWNRQQGSITCLDVGSTDDTLKIIERLHYRFPDLKVVALRQEGEMDSAIKDWLKAQGIPKKHLIVLDLREGEHHEQKANQFLA